MAKKCIKAPLGIKRRYQKAESYQHTKFRSDISISGRDITTSGFDFDLSTAIGM